MGIEAIVDAIGTEAEAERARIRADTEERVARIMADAQQRSDEVMHRLEASRDEEATAAAAAIINRARLGADRHLAAIRESLFEEAVDRLRQLLADAVAGPEYDEMLTRLYDEAVVVIGTEAATVLVRPQDAELMSSIIDTAGHSNTVVGSLTCIGGLDVEAGDGRSVRNTIDSRLEKSDPRLRQLAVEMIPELAARVGGVE